MALVLDGSGDITGLVDGALPSNVVGSGAVLQVVSTSYNTEFSTTSGTMTDTGWTFTFTPTRASSKVLIMARVTQRVIGYSFGTLQFVRGSSTVLSPAPATAFESGITTSSADMRYIGSYVYLDSPNTTSQITYKVQMSTHSGSTMWMCASGNPASVVMMEIAG